MPRREHVIGLTGNIACGKSTVADMLQQLGAETIDADTVVHRMMGAGSPFAHRLRQSFGERVVNSDDSINRPELGRIVFSDPENFDELEEIVHPAVIAEMDAAIEQSGPPVLVLDAIKLFEAGIADKCDHVWVVSADRETQIARIVQRNNVDRAEAERRIDAQPPQSEKVRRADLIIDNSGSLENTRNQVLDAWNQIVART